MDENLPAIDTNTVSPDNDQLPDSSASDVAQIHQDFYARLIAANLRTEAVQAGMVDLDGLKLLDLAGIELDDHDRIVGGRKLMADLRRGKPWLFRPTSSSSAASVPTSQPVRQKMAMDMTDDEYVSARNAMTKYQL